MKSGEELVKWVHENHKASTDHLKDWLKKAKECYDFYAGKQLSSEDEAYLDEARRAKIIFNRVRPMISAVKGQQIANRQRIQYLPRTLGDARQNETLTSVAKWVDDECNAEDNITECFEDLTICGMGAAEMRVSYDEDLDGKIHSAVRFSPFELRWDPSSPARNLEGGKWRQRGRWMDRSEANERWPKLKDQEPSNTQGMSVVDEPPEHDADLASSYTNDSRQWYNAHRDQVFVIQQQWWERVATYRVGDPASGQLLELSPKKYEKLKDILQMSGIKAVKQMKKVYYQAFVCGDLELESGDAPCPKEFTLFAMTGYRDMGSGTFFGLVEGMIDPQRWANKFFMDTQDILSKNRMGGAFVESGALADPRHAEQQWNQPDALILLNDGAIAQNKIMERNPLPYPDSMDRMAQIAIGALPAVTGINQEMMGYAERDQANVLEIQRKKAALTVLADLFDSMSRFSKDRGRALIYFMKTYINDGRLARITTDQGEQYVPIQIADVQYDTIVDEAPNTPNQKQETFAVITQLLPYFKSSGIPIPPEVLEYMPLPTSMVASIKKMGQQPQPPSAEDLLNQAKMQTELSKKQKNEAEAAEAMANAEAQKLQNQAVMSGLVHPVDAQL